MANSIIQLVSCINVSETFERPSEPPAAIPRLRNARHWPGIRVKTQRFVAMPGRISATWQIRRGDERGTAPEEANRVEPDWVYDPVDDGWPGTHRGTPMNNGLMVLVQMLPD